MAAGRQFTIIHFNDVYNIEAAPREPVGGAARFVAQVKALSHLRPLVLFSGDAFNPSLMSTITLGKQMVPILNAAGVAAACVGNHDWDFGLDNFASLSRECSFPWLLSNVDDVATGAPPGGAIRSLLIEHEGVKVGLMGLAESEWIDTLSCVSPDDLSYTDFVEAGRELAAELRGKGADIVVALTHMREPQDTRLASEVEGCDIVLGGHDHFYKSTVIEPYGTPLVKSGTDFREFSVITVNLPAGPAQAGTVSSSTAAGNANGSSTNGQAEQGAAAGSSNVPQQQQQQQQQQQEEEDARRRQRPRFDVRRVEVASAALPEDPSAAEVVERFAALMGSRLGSVIGATAVDLDGRFSTVRRRESNLGNLLVDILRRACSADVAFVNGGTFRSDVIHPAGDITLRDLVSILPMLDETVVIEPTGAQLLAALENSVSQWPALEGRFLQVSGLRFIFDPTRAPGERVVEGSVMVSGQPLELERRYKVATKEFLYLGKDGFDALTGANLLIDSEDCIMLNTAARNFFMMLEVVNRLKAGNGDGGASFSSAAGGTSFGGGMRRVKSFARRWKHRAQAGDHISAPGGQAESSTLGFKQDVARAGNCVWQDDRCRFVVAPGVEGRIVCTQPLPDK